MLKMLNWVKKLIDWLINWLTDWMIDMTFSALSSKLKMNYIISNYVTLKLKTCTIKCQKWLINCNDIVIYSLQSRLNTEQQLFGYRMES